MDMRGRQLFSVACAGCLALSASGCGNMTKEQIGSLTGAVAGGVIGNMVPARYRGLAILGGIIIGSYIGSKIGAALDEADRTALSKHMALGLTQGKSGQQFAWANQQTGASATYVTRETKPSEKSVRVVRQSAMEAPPRLEVDGRMHQSASRLDIRNGPNDKATVAGTIAAGETIKVYGKLAGSPWLVVARDGRAVGYVPVGGLKPATASEPSLLVAAGSGAATPPEGSVIDEISVKTRCRELEYQITKQGAQPEQGKTDACQTPDGHWLTNA